MQWRPGAVGDDLECGGIVRGKVTLTGWGGSANVLRGFGREVVRGAAFREEAGVARAAHNVPVVHGSICEDGRISVRRTDGNHLLKIIVVVAHGREMIEDQTTRTFTPARFVISMGSSFMMRVVLHGRQLCARLTRHRFAAEQWDTSRKQSDTI